MAIVVTSMAAASCGQVVVSRACLRNRDPNDLLFAADEVPNSSKRLCVAADRELESPSVVSLYEKSAAAADHGVQTITLQRRPVTSPQQSSVAAAAAAAEGDHEEWKMNKGWEALELCLLERITRSLSLADLCRLSQVSKHYREMCGRDEVWKFKGEEKERLLMRKVAAAADSGTSCLKPSTNFSTTTASTDERLQATPLIASDQIHFSGDVAILDPFELFALQKAELKQIVKEHKYQDLVLTYRGMQSAVLRTSCAVDGDDSAFEVFRDGKEVGANVTSSAMLAVVPKKLLLQLVHENGSSSSKLLEHGVLVEAVDGLLRRSLDGDFIIRHQEPARGTKVELPFSGEVDYADVVCSTGGSWTEDTDSEDDEQDLTEEEMAEALREAALLTLKSSCKSATENVTSKLDLSLQSCS
jgi:hypothetical protein